MSTRTINVVFTGADIKTLPGARFLFIKAATASLNITLRDRGNGTQNTLSGVGAGARYKLQRGDDPWRFTDVESAVAQTVTLVISDDAEFDIANTVTVSGAVNSVELPAASIADAVDAALASGAETTIAANLSRRTIKIGVLSTAGNGVRVSQAGGANTRGEEIQPGTSAWFPTTAALIVRNANLAADASNAVWWSEEYS